MLKFTLLCSTSNGFVKHPQNENLLVNLTGYVIKISFTLQYCNTLLVTYCTHLKKSTLKLVALIQPVISYQNFVLSDPIRNQFNYKDFSNQKLKILVDLESFSCCQSGDRRELNSKMLNLLWFVL